MRAGMAKEYFSRYGRVMGVVSGAPSPRAPVDALGRISAYTPRLTPDTGPTRCSGYCAHGKKRLGNDFITQASPDARVTFLSSDMAKAAHADAPHTIQGNSQVGAGCMCAT